MIVTVLREEDVFHELDDIPEMIFLEYKNLKTVIDNSSLIGEHFVNTDLKYAVCGNVLLFGAGKIIFSVGFI
jgi:hypothetical protein